MSLLHIELKRPALPYFFFEVPGEPVACERPRVTRFGSYLPTKSRNAQKDIGWNFRAAFPSHKPDELNSFGARVRLFKSKGGRRDVDNFLKLIFDSMNGVLYKDDSQIREVYCVVTQNHRPRTEILFYQINEDYLAKCGETE